MFFGVASSISGFVDWINGNILSPIMMVVILLTGIIFTVRLRCLQVTKFKDSMNETIIPAVKSAFKKTEDESHHGISQFQAFSAAIAGTVGTGNVVGVATALALGGPGAIFWMWFSAFFGMLTNFCENVLGIYFREKGENGEYKGGAMYYITHGLGWKWLGVMFAVFCILASIGFNLAQVNSIASTFTSYKIPTYVTGIVLMVIVALVVVGGIKRIGKVASYIVPVMAVFFIILACIIIGMNITHVPRAFALIFKGAFSFKSFGSGIMGYGLIRAMRYGIQRGVFSNEAGLGSSVIAHSQSDVVEPVKQGLWGIFEVFFDTFVICTLMVLVFLTSGVYDTFLAGGVEMGSPMAMLAFESELGMFGKISYTLILPLFAFTTILSWNFYGQKAFEYIFGTKASIVYKVIYVLLIIVGATQSVELVWNLSDTFNVLMAVPNLISLIAMQGLLKDIVFNYYDRKKGMDIVPMLSVFKDENERLMKKL